MKTGSYLISLIFLVLSNKTNCQEKAQALIISSYGSFSQNPAPGIQGVQKIAENIYVLSNSGCNITAFCGEDGTMIIDSGTKRSGSRTDSVISSLSALPVKYVLNTHLHFDHVGGNGKLAEKGAVIVAHENTRKNMLKEWKVPAI